MEFNNKVVIVTGGAQGIGKRLLQRNFRSRVPLYAALISSQEYTLPVILHSRIHWRNLLKK